MFRLLPILATAALGACYGRHEDAGEIIDAQQGTPAGRAA